MMIAFPVAHGMGEGMGMGSGIAMMLAMLLLVVLAILGVIWLVRYLIREHDPSSFASDAPEGALQVLERSFAKGEIDADEYRRRRSTLERAQ